MTRLEAVRGDITAETVDAIVNAANSGLAPGGGVCGAIFAAAGPGLVEACEALGGCAPGDAKATPGFALPARWIIHTVGPVWAGGGRGEDELLASCYRKCFELAEEHNARSISFPSISTGAYGYPLQEAAGIAMREVMLQLERAEGGVREAIFVLFDRKTYDVHAQALAELSRQPPE